MAVNKYVLKTNKNHPMSEVWKCTLCCSTYLVVWKANWVDIDDIGWVPMTSCLVSKQSTVSAFGDCWDGMGCIFL